MRLSPIRLATLALLLVAVATASAAGPPRADLPDLSYGPDPAHRLDVYRPARARKAPIVVMVHGGGWRIGSKDARGVVGHKAERSLANGRIFVSIDYRLLPGADPLSQAEDVARALAYVQRTAPRWGGDPAQVVLMGHSAGAHLVALLAAAPDIARAQGAQAWRGTVALDSAAYDVDALMRRPHLPLYDQAFGREPDYWRRASPTLRLRAAPAPMLLVCSSQRRLSCVQADAFARRASELGGRAEVLRVDLNHAQINADLGLPGDYTAKVEAFLASLRSTR
ncbi:alpha/beta hydrolase [Lysobacter sp. cf310]|uniref:alpha/beta hydrolase n=1 Tax=Lysobacter sp. cf310 TaxID=1761790 RepID=UPI0008E27C5B|nr:alpha/beta hydrolase [Lysobacter sp. cf310]SFK68733.1 Acetyl esterase/lipase [Lysobacter sp. cf310]